VQGAVHVEDDGVQGVGEAYVLWLFHKIRMNAPAFTVNPCVRDAGRARECNIFLAWGVTPDQKHNMNKFAMPAAGNKLIKRFFWFFLLTKKLRAVTLPA